VIYIGQWRTLVDTVIIFLVPKMILKFLSNCTIGGFSRRAQLHRVIYSQFYSSDNERLLAHEFLVCG
jgi:hypothetical protein